jgi:FhuF 2Fe-2S C-terminal domain
VLVSTIAAALESAGSLGPFFTVDTSPDVPDDPLWRPLTELYGRALPDQVTGARMRLGDSEPRVAASLLFQGIAARLWSPALALAADGIVLDLDPARVYWRAASPGPVLLAVPSPAASAGTLHDEVVTRNLAPLVAAVRSVTPVADGLLWGNAASALTGAARTLPRSGELVSELLGTAPLRGTLVPGTFQRRSCCLYYRIPGGGKCGDCSLL